MSRSRRHHPVTGITKARSEKWDKRRANRALRAGVHSQMQTWDTDPMRLFYLDMLPTEWAYDDHVLPELRQVSNVWSMEKDGKGWFDPDQHPKLMRK